MTTSKPSGPRAFLWWFLAVQAVPMAGILALPDIARIWILILFGNTCVLHFNFGRHDIQGYRIFHYLIGGLFGVMTVAWTIRLAVSIYQSETLSL